MQNFDITRYVNGMQTSEITQFTIRYIRLPHQEYTVNTMIMNGWLTSFAYHVNWPSHSWDKAQSLTLKLQDQGHGVIKSQGHIVIPWVVLTLLCGNFFLLVDVKALTLGQGNG